MYDLQEFIRIVGRKKAELERNLADLRERFLGDILREKEKIIAEREALLKEEKSLEDNIEKCKRGCKEVASSGIQPSQGLFEIVAGAQAYLQSIHGSNQPVVEEKEYTPEEIQQVLADIEREKKSAMEELNRLKSLQAKEEQQSKKQASIAAEKEKALKDLKVVEENSAKLSKEKAQLQGEQERVMKEQDAKKEQVSKDSKAVEDALAKLSEEEAQLVEDQSSIIAKRGEDIEALEAAQENLKKLEVEEKRLFEERAQAMSDDQTYTGSQQSKQKEYTSDLAGIDERRQKLLKDKKMYENQLAAEESLLTNLSAQEKVLDVELCALITQCDSLDVPHEKASEPTATPQSLSSQQLIAKLNVNEKLIATNLEKLQKEGAKLRSELAKLQDEQAVSKAKLAALEKLQIPAELKADDPITKIIDDIYKECCVTAREMGAELYTELPKAKMRKAEEYNNLQQIIRTGLDRLKLDGHAKLLYWKAFNATVKYMDQNREAWFAIPLYADDLDKEGTPWCDVAFKFLEGKKSNDSTVKTRYYENRAELQKEFKKALLDSRDCILQTTRNCLDEVNKEIVPKNAAKVQNETSVKNEQAKLQNLRDLRDKCADYSARRQAFEVSKAKIVEESNATQAKLKLQQISDWIVGEEEKYKISKAKFDRLLVEGVAAAAKVDAVKSELQKVQDKKAAQKLLVGALPSKIAAEDAQLKAIKLKLQQVSADISSNDAQRLLLDSTIAQLSTDDAATAKKLEDIKVKLAQISIKISEQEALQISLKKKIDALSLEATTVAANLATTQVSLETMCASISGGAMQPLSLSSRVKNRKLGLGAIVKMLKGHSASICAKLSELSALEKQLEGVKRHSDDVQEKIKDIERKEEEVQFYLDTFRKPQDSQLHEILDETISANSELTKCLRETIAAYIKYSGQADNDDSLCSSLNALHKALDEYLRQMSKVVGFDIYNLFADSDKQTIQDSYTSCYHLSNLSAKVKRVLDDSNAQAYDLYERIEKSKILEELFAVCDMLGAYPKCPEASALGAFIKAPAVDVSPIWKFFEQSDSEEKVEAPREQKASLEDQKQGVRAIDQGAVEHKRRVAAAELCLDSYVDYLVQQYESAALDSSARDECIKKMETLFTDLYSALKQAEKAKSENGSKSISSASSPLAPVVKLLVNDVDNTFSNKIKGILWIIWKKIVFWKNHNDFFKRGTSQLSKGAAKDMDKLWKKLPRDAKEGIKEKFKEQRPVSGVAPSGRFFSPVVPASPGHAGRMVNGRDGIVTSLPTSQPHFSRANISAR